MEEAGVPGENHPDHGQATGKLYHLRLSRMHPFLAHLTQRVM